jgi:hypothetical protein
MRTVLKHKNGKKYGRWNIEELKNLEKIIPDFRIEAIKTKHHFSFSHYSYLITWHGKRIYLNGDTENTTTVEGIKNMDWAFVPGWLLISIFKNKIELDTKMIALYHVAKGDSIKIDHPKILVLDKQGEIIRIPY